MRKQLLDGDQMIGRAFGVECAGTMARERHLGMLDDQ